MVGILSIIKQTTNVQFSFLLHFYKVHYSYRLNHINLQIHANCKVFLQIYNFNKVISLRVVGGSAQRLGVFSLVTCQAWEAERHQHAIVLQML